MKCCVRGGLWEFGETIHALLLEREGSDNEHTARTWERISRRGQSRPSDRPNWRQRT